MNTTVKKWQDLEDGDIFYFDINNGLNKDLIGRDYDLTGTDCIFIRDDFGAYEDSVLVNGGHHIFFKEEDKVFVIGHYSKLLKSTECLK